mmetsp:Transcript_95996/g.248683  ORF Transcript_95996/g.248683 Transcript_95996/m.248683 type:complete len:158 (+) Transcript_95996:832-1305(+)
MRLLLRRVPSPPRPAAARGGSEVAAAGGTAMATALAAAGWHGRRRRRRGARLAATAVQRSRAVPLEPSGTTEAGPVLQASATEGGDGEAALLPSLAQAAGTHLCKQLPAKPAMEAAVVAAAVGALARENPTARFAKAAGLPPKAVAMAPATSSPKQA